MTKKFFTAKKEKVVLSPCEQCKLCTVCISPKLRPVGKGKLGIAIVIDKPHSSMDTNEYLASGPEYIFLKNTLNKIGIDLEEDCWLVPVIGCRTPKDRAPTTKEVKFCKDRFTRFMEDKNPNVIIPMGAVAFDAVVGYRIKGRLTGTGWDEFIGTIIPDQEMQKFIAPNYSIETMLEVRKYDDGGISKPLYMRDSAWYNLWKDNFYNACSKWSEQVQIVDYTSMCHITENIDQAIDWISEAMNWESVALDYETTGIKPYRKGHKIWCTSISNGEVSYAFPFFDDPLFLRIWKRLMTSDVKKICHNMAYEGLWTRELCGYWMQNWYWDTMLGQHCVNNTKSTGLKYCTYTEFGVLGYDESAAQYIEKSDEDKEEFGDNCINNIHLAPIKDLLLYNALDSLFTHLLVDKQKEKFMPHQFDGMAFLMESAFTLTKIQHNGFYLNTKRYEEVTKELEQIIADINVKILATDEVKLWDGEEPFNHNSSTQLSHLLFDILKVPVKNKTAKGSPSVDAEALEKIKNPLVTLILAQRKYIKLLGTYIHQYKVEATNGKIHSFFYLNRVDTYRSSCGSVNIQNLPKRDENAKRMITSLVLPKKGHKLIAYDYKSLEVLINACHSGDKNLIEFTSNPAKDMHRSSAADIFMLEESQVTKRVRSGIKSAFVFSSFYGSYYKQTAFDCYELAKEEGLIEHLSSKGIDTYAKFEQRVKKAEEILWGSRFKKHDEWRKDCYNKYLRNGYLDTFTGFRLNGPMRRNNTFNSPVQGDAYHVMQWALNKCVAEMEERKMEAYCWAEVHDAADFSCPPEEEDMLDYLVGKWFIRGVTEHWDWITVNLQIEKEAGEIDGDWSTLKGIGFVDEFGNIIKD